MNFKELFQYLFILNVLQFSLTKTVEKSLSSQEEVKKLTPKQKLKDFYENELKIISKEYCKKAKNISEYVLKDETIKQAQTHEIQQFKKNITEFLNKYESYARYGLYSELVDNFKDTTINYFQNVENEAQNVTDDASYIKNLLIKLGYIQMDNNYANKYSEFIVKKFIYKFEELKSQLNVDELRKEESTLKWLEKLKTCKDYHCQLETFSNFAGAPKDNLVEYIRKSILDIFIYYSVKAIIISNKLLKDDALLQAKTSFAEEFKNNITEFTEKYNTNYDPDELPVIAELYSNTTAYYSEIPKVRLNTDSNLILSVLRKLGSEQIEIECEEKFHDWMVNKLAAKFVEFKSQLDKEELEKQQPLLDWYEKLKTRKTSVVVALENLYAL